MDPDHTQPLIINVWQRINAVMGEVSYVKKQQGSAGLSYKTVSHDAVIGLLRGPMTKWGLGFYHNIEDFKHEGNRITIKVRLRLVNVDNPDDFIESIVYSEGLDGQDKGYGKGLSYACKYFLLKTFCLETGDKDNDSGVDSDGASEVFDPGYISDFQARVIRELIGNDKILETNVLKYIPKNDLKNLTADRYEGVIEHINKYLTEKKSKQ